MDDIIEKALISLEVAESNLNNRYYPDSINRSYYAVFHAAKALLIKKGIITKTHSGTISAFGLEYIKKEALIKKMTFLLILKMIKKCWS
ncbi:HEPN domain-containing protein [Methanobrevibacter filiformis]|uniref:HEPN domain protein n=1 Tax=Methanobrevibacter filiformis TaxID=55758 RepID=A0A162FFJ1_9EURY|nr:HEPN domain-containing protein [Methanobrevibacter filiformis]KZX12345.1 HEPN domain protein [Methanobrevibacter filiformis]